ncbi:hypothetical protein FRC12_001592 [Ceratobasidium sp. 428]|nr:hypothetical protein FRC12_001592 [Ceratobasidium sp. 428]
MFSHTFCNPRPLSFALSIPDTSSNLSYGSLTSCEARAAILELQSTDLTFYAKITSGAPVTVLEVQAQMEDMAAEGSASDEDDPAVLTVPGLCTILLNATSASDLLLPAVAEHSKDEADLDDKYEADSDDQYEGVSVQLPLVVTPTSTAQSIAGPRRSAQLSVRHTAY